tara:strand:+ start:1524 stop:1742 length:219 start_codon:yes stop_codon:yes gene_type:complete
MKKCYIYGKYYPMSHKVFIRHTYIYKCESCNGEWKINEAANIEKLSCPHCGKVAPIEYVQEDQRRNYYRKHI